MTLYSRPRGAERRPSVWSQLCHVVVVWLGQVSPFPEPQFPHLKAKAASHLLLPFWVAGAMASVRAAPGWYRGRQTEIPWVVLAVPSDNHHF